MKPILKTILIIFILLSKSWAQTNDKTTCLNNLSAASRLYEKAQFNEAIALLEPCIKSGNLNNHKSDAYRILALCYHQLGDEVNTNTSILNLLKNNHNYKLFPLNDPKDFTKVVNTFTVESIFFAGIKAGINYSLPHITSSYSVKPATIETQGQQGQLLGLNLDYFFKDKKISINGWGQSSQISFTQNAIFNEYEKINYKEELKYMDFGAEVRYHPIKKARVKPYLGLGFNTLLLRSGLSNLNFNNSFSNTKTESTRDLKELKIANKSLVNAVIDVGASLHAGKGELGIGLQYNKAFKNSNNTSKRYENIDYVLINQWVDSDIKINYLNIYASYSFPLLWRVYK